MSTLESAGYLYSPFTTADIFGHPPPFNLTQVNQTVLPVGRDNSALPELAQPALTSNSNVSGSGRGEFRKQTRQDVMRTNGTLTTTIFAVVIAIAVLWKR